MVVENNLTEEQKKYAVDLMITMVVAELSEESGLSPEEILPRFIASQTGSLLYDEESKLWWNGPSYIAEMYRKEMSSSNNAE